MKKNLVALSLLMGLATVNCGDNKAKEDQKQNTPSAKPEDKGDSSSESSQTKPADKDDSNTETDKNKDNRIFLPDLTVNEGDPCDPKKEFYGCKQNKIMYCDKDYNIWQENYSTCGDTHTCLAWKETDFQGQVEVDYACYLSCNPANETEKITCELDDPYDPQIEERDITYRYYVDRCENIVGHDVWVRKVDKACGACGNNKECIITDEQKGLNAKPGDPCNAALFVGRCDGDTAINCVDTSYRTDNDIEKYHGIVLSEACSASCAVYTDEDYTFAYCPQNETCIKENIEEGYNVYHLEKDNKCYFIINPKLCINGHFSYNFTEADFLIYDIGSDWCEEGLEEICQDEDESGNPKDNCIHGSEIPGVEF